MAQDELPDDIRAARSDAMMVVMAELLLFLEHTGGLTPDETARVFDNALGTATGLAQSQVAVLANLVQALRPMRPGLMET